LSNRMSEMESTYTGSTVTGVSSTARRKIINVEASTLFQLKSELAKKDSEVTNIRSKLGNFKAPTVARKLLPEHLKAKRKARKEEKKNAGVESRDTVDREQMAKERDIAERVKRKLEAKSRLYDRVNKGKDDLDEYLRENCLVDFEGKEIPKERQSERGREKERHRERHTSYQSESDLIEHTDALGRTSFINKNQLQDMRKYDREITDLKRKEFDEHSSRYSDGSRSPSPESKQARFQNIEDGDVRELGVGYYNFSTDDATRTKQLGLLATLRESTKETRQVKQSKESQKAEKTRRFLEKKRARLAQLRGLKVDDIAIPETEVIIDAPEPKQMDRTEMNIDRNIATAKKGARDWDKDKDMDEIYGADEGRRRPVASESAYYEKMRNERNDQFAPSYEDKASSSTPSYYTERYLAEKQQEQGGGGGGGGNYHQGFVQANSYSNQYGGNRYNGNGNQNNWGQNQGQNNYGQNNYGQNNYGQNNYGQF